MDSGYRGTLIGNGSNNAINPTNVEIKLFESFNGGTEIQTNGDITRFSTNANTEISGTLKVNNDVSLNGNVDILGSIKVNNVRLSNIGVNGNLNVIGASVLQDVSVNNLYVQGSLFGNKSQLYTRYVSLNNIIADVSVVSNATTNFNAGILFSNPLFNSSGQWLNNTSIISLTFHGKLDRTNVKVLLSKFQVGINGSIPQGISKVNNTDNIEVYWTTGDCKFQINRNDQIWLETIYCQYNGGSGINFNGSIQLLVY